MKTLRFTFIAFTAAVLAAACAGRNLPMQTASLPTPQSVSPALIAPAPMAKTAIQPSTKMSSIKPESSIQGLNWTNIAGLASQLAIAPNGTLYAINSGGGTFSYSAGTWTALGGGAQALTAASDGSTYV